MNSTDLKLPIPAIDLVPHRNRMLLIQNLNSFGKGFGSGSLKISKNSLFVTKNGRLDPIVYVELLAQLVAAHSGYESKLEKSNPKIGFLVGIKDFIISKNISVNDSIEMQIQKDYEFAQINYVNGKILYNNEIIAGGTLKLWEPTGDIEITDAATDDPAPGEHAFKLTTASDRIVQEMDLNRAITENIYELNITDDGLAADGKLYFPEQFVGFDGHFPGSPLLPGVLMMKTGLLLAEVILEKELQLIKIQQAKFAKSIFPNQDADINVKINYPDEKIKINIVISRNEEVCSKFSFLARNSENK